MVLEMDRGFIGLRNLALTLTVTALFSLTSFQVLVPNMSTAVVKDFNIGMGESVTSANPFWGIYDSDDLFYSYIYDELIFPDEDGSPTPNLASSWWYMNGITAASSGSDFSTLTHHRNASDWPTGSIWEYNLTKNVYWNDGEPFTADDVIFTLKFQIGTSYIMVWKYQPYTKWIDRCEKIDDYKIRIYFSDRETHNPMQIAWGDSLSMPIMPKHIFGQYPEPYIVQNWTGIPAIGTGPFMPTESLRNEIIAKESITLVRNPYWNFIDANGAVKGLGGAYNRSIQIDQLNMEFYADEATLVVDLKTHKLDVAKTSSTNYFALMEDSNKPASLSLVSSFSCSGLSKVSHFNVWEGASASLNPTRLDPAVLRATELATNKSYITDLIFKGLATPGTGILSPVWPQYYWTPPHNRMSVFNVTDGTGAVKWSYSKALDEVMSYNLTLANEILDEAGYIWTDSTHTLRKVGPDAADRLVNLGIVGDPSNAIGKTLEFEDILENTGYDDKKISEYLTSEWTQIGIGLTQQLRNIDLWNNIVYGFQYLFTEGSWQGNPDPNYLLYIPTSYAMDGWNEFGTMNDTYDHYYDMQASTMNFSERKVWVDRCQEWQYLAGTAMMVTCYPKTCFAYNDAANGLGSWTNWGNWTLHPGLAIDHHWGETPLFYHIKWQEIIQEPPTPVFAILVMTCTYIGVGTIAIFFAVRATKPKKDERD